MPDTPKLAKAELMELNAKFTEVINTDKSTIPFNSIRIRSRSATPTRSSSLRAVEIRTAPRRINSSARDRPSLPSNCTSMSQARFPPVRCPEGKADTNDVRVLTQRVAYFITPVGEPKNKPKKYIPPSVRFVWGTFQFDGIMESMEETLEIFSAEGRPLRATVAIAITQQQITEFAFNDKGVKDPPEVTKKSGAGKKPPGTTPLAEAPAKHRSRVWLTRPRESAVTGRPSPRSTASKIPACCPQGS